MIFLKEWECHLQMSVCAQVNIKLPYGAHDIDNKSFMIWSLVSIFVFIIWHTPTTALSAFIMKRIKSGLGLVISNVMSFSAYPRGIFCRLQLTLNERESLMMMQLSWASFESNLNICVSYVRHVSAINNA